MTQEDALKWVAELFEESADKISPSTAREDIPAWDSLGVLTLMADFDEKHDIVLSDEDMKAMKTVDDILEVLRKHGKLT